MKLIAKKTQEDLQLDVDLKALEDAFKNNGPYQTEITKQKEFRGKIKLDKVEEQMLTIECENLEKQAHSLQDTYELLSDEKD